MPTTWWTAPPVAASCFAFDCCKSWLAINRPLDMRPINQSPTSVQVEGGMDIKIWKMCCQTSNIIHHLIPMSISLRWDICARPIKQQTVNLVQFNWLHQVKHWRGCRMRMLCASKMHHCQWGNMRTTPVYVCAIHCQGAQMLLGLFHTWNVARATPCYRRIYIYSHTDQLAKLLTIN